MTALVAVATVMVHALFRVITEPAWYTTGDEAATVVRALDVFSAEHPLVGPYSRVGWDHPGPLLFQLLAVPATVAGSASRGAAIGALVITAVSLTWAVRTLARSTGEIGAAIGAAAALLVLIWNPNGPWTTWGPYVALAPLLLFVCSAVCVSLGDRSASLPFVITAHLLVQTHAGFLPIVAASTLFLALIWFASARSREPELPRLDAVLGLAGLGVLLGLPMLIDMIAGSRNLLEVARWSLADSSPKIGIRDAAGIVVHQLFSNPFAVSSNLGGQVFAAAPPRGNPHLLYLVVAGLLALVLLALRRRDRVASTTLLWSIVLLLVTVISFSRIDAPLGWISHWGIVISIGTWSSVGIAALHLFPTRFGRTSLSAVLAVVATSLLVPRVLVLDNQRQFPDGGMSTVEARANQQEAVELLSSILPPTGRFAMDTANWFIDRGLVLGLIEQNKEFVVPPGRKNIWGDHRRSAASAPGPVWHIHFVNGPVDDSFGPVGAGWTLVWKKEVFDATERAALIEARDNLMREVDIVDPEPTTTRRLLMYMDRIDVDCGRFGSAATSCAVYTRLVERGREARLWVRTEMID